MNCHGSEIFLLTKSTVNLKTRSFPFATIFPESLDNKNSKNILVIVFVSQHIETEPRTASFVAKTDYLQSSISSISSRFIEFSRRKVPSVLRKQLGIKFCCKKLQQFVNSNRQTKRCEYVTRSILSTISMFEHPGKFLEKPSVQFKDKNRSGVIPARSFSSVPRVF